MSDDLKPCPFCGGKAEAINYIIEGAVRCTDCGVSVARRHDAQGDTGYDEAIAAWNTRTKTKAEQAFDQQIADYVKRGKP